MTVYKLRNNSMHPHAFAAGLCVSGAGCPPNPEWQQVMQATGKGMPPLYEMSELQMFRSHRGVLAAMKVRTLRGQPEIEVLADGIGEPLTEKQLNAAMDEYREKHGHPKPDTKEAHVAEMERSMNRPEDPIEKAQRLEREKRDERLFEMVAKSNRDMVASLVQELFAKEMAKLAAEPDVKPAAADAKAPTPPANKAR